ncbi:MAG: dienelactone hydrolase family protein [Clostridia bacterium]|nr:dienelactone hydrolase family protein [Clostridia bacterium]
MYFNNSSSPYNETEAYGNGYRVTYLKGIEKLIEERKKDCLKKRIKFGEEIAEDREEYRKKYFDMLGWPLNEEKKPILSVRQNKIFENDTCEYIRMQFELFEGYFFYGILLKHKSQKALPLVISQHGGLGTPEFCSSFFESSNYNDMSLRILNGGVNVFAPQTLLWQKERFGPENRRVEIDNSLKQLGGSIAALEIYSIIRCIDYFEEQDFCDGQFGMAGLSYGGFYTLYTAAAEPRIKAALACSHFNDRTKYNWHDKVWFKSGENFLDAQVAALVCPRFLRIEVGDNDELFDASSAKEEYEILKSYYSSAPENLQFNIFKGVHEFCPEDDGINILLSKLR